MPKCELRESGRLDYSRALELQQRLVAQRKADWKAAQVEREAAKAKAAAPKPPGWDDPGMAELRARVAAIRKKYPPKPPESQPE